MPIPDASHEDRIRVLITEDEASFLEVLSKVLHSTDRFTVTPCTTGEDALKALTMTQFDVVILDLKLPGMSGLNVLQWMNEQKLDTPVVILTGTGSEFAAAETMKYGAYDYIAKDDFDKDRFPNIIAGVFDQHRFKKAEGGKTEEEGRPDLKSLEVLSTTISSLAHAANTALATVKLLTEECQATLLPLLTLEGKTRLRISYEAIKKEHEVVIAVTRSILELSTAMFNKYDRMQKSPTPVLPSPASVEKSERQEPPTSDENTP